MVALLTKLDYVALCLDLLVLSIEVKINETLHDQLLYLFVLSTGLVYQLYLLLQFRYFLHLEALVLDALLKLFVDYDIRESPQRRSEMGIVLQV